jgi:hypothetical protein
LLALPAALNGSRRPYLRVQHTQNGERAEKSKEAPDKMNDRMSAHLLGDRRRERGAQASSHEEQRGEGADTPQQPKEKSHTQIQTRQLADVAYCAIHCVM